MRSEPNHSLKVAIKTGKGVYFSDADALYRYGGGSGPIHFAGFHCSGNESTLLRCPVDRSGVTEITNCGHHEDAGVRCTSGK